MGSFQRARDAALLIVVLAMGCVAAPIALAAGSGGGSGNGPIGSFDPVLLGGVGAAALVIAVLGVLAVRRPRHWRQGIPVSDAVPKEARVAQPRSPDDPVPFAPRLRELELGDEARMPRWLRPSVRAERFTQTQADARSPANSASSEDAVLKEGSVDLDALFARRRSPKASSKPSNRVTRGRRKTAPS